MVKKKYQSKRTSLKDKYKIQKRVTETHRKDRRQAKRDAANGIVKHKKRDPGIPSSWPFKQDLLKEIQRAKEIQQQKQAEIKEKRQEHLQMLREHQQQGGTAQTVKELLARAQRDQQAFDAKQEQQEQQSNHTLDGQRRDGTVAAGQQSRRAYLRELRKVVDTADVLLQVLDARDPVSTRMHPTMENAILSRPDKKMVLVLNKIDLVPKDVVGAWLTALRRAHPTIALKAGVEKSLQAGGGSMADDATAATSATTSGVPVGMEGLLQLLKNYARTGGSGGGKSKTTIVVGIVGYPNVGKSSIINALKRTRAVGVSPRPGFTTSLQEVVLDRNVRLLDSPGVVFDDRAALLGNCVDAESVPDPVPAVQALLKRCNHASILMTYNIPDFPPGNVMMFLAMIARSYGRVLKGGIPDKMSAARTVLKDWNSGKIPFFTVPPQETAPEKANDAVIVSSFGKEFDAYNAAVLDSLKDRDEMDFVQMADNHPVDQDNEATRKRVQKMSEFVLRDSNMDESDDDDDMETEDVALNTQAGKARLRAAESFDFRGAR